MNIYDFVGSSFVPQPLYIICLLRNEHVAASPDITLGSLFYIMIKKEIRVRLVAIADLAVWICRQLLGIILSCVFWNLLVDMSQSPDMVDFKLKRAEINYSELDLAGAGWCMCLPRDGGYLPVPASESDLDPIDIHLEKLKKQPRRTHAQLREMQQSRSASGLDEVDAGRKKKRDHWAYLYFYFSPFTRLFGFFWPFFPVIVLCLNCVALLVEIVWLDQQEAKRNKLNWALSFMCLRQRRHLSLA